jgi:MinD-like ATPase involved in chromosome partitioning or flagellar assembly
MALIALAGLHGAPGVTTLGLALAHHLDALGRTALFVEADPDGGTIAARHGVSINPGLTELAGAARVGLPSSDILQFAQPLPSGLQVIAASPMTDRVHAALRTSGTHLAEAFHGVSLTRDVVVDLGRLRPIDPTQALAGAADCLIYVARPLAEELVPLMNRLAGTATEHVMIALVGDHPYATTEVAQATGVQTIVTIPEDHRAVRSDPSGAHRRGAWPAGVRKLTKAVLGRVGELTGSELSDTEPVGAGR